MLIECRYHPSSQFGNICTERVDCRTLSFFSNWRLITEKLPNGLETLDLYSMDIAF